MLGGIVHAAGVLDDGMAVQQNKERFRNVLAPKVAGAWNMQSLADEYGSRFFVMFSAGAAVLGSRGQTSYAAANGFMDALAHRRYSLGRPAMAIDWGVWGESGMAASLANRERQRLADLGVATMSPDRGIEIFERLARAGTPPQIAVLSVAWPQYVAQTGPSRPFFSRLTAAPARGAAVDAAPVAATLAARLAATAAAARVGVLTAHVQESALRVLGLPPTFALDVHQGLRDVGLDSLMAVELRNVLQASVGQSLPPTLAFDYPTVAALSRYLAEEILGFARVDANAPEVGRDRPDVIADVRALTDEEAEAQLAAELSALQQTDTHGH
jgi:hypothetical protein